MTENDEKTIAKNRKARHDYFIDETYEAGIVLRGSEIKSIRDGRVNLRDSFVLVRDGEAWVHNLHIAPYRQSSTHEDLDPRRPRKLLLHKRQIGRLAGLVAQKGVTIVPLRMYLKHNLAKLEIAVATGKKQYDKRQDIKEREHQREIERALKRWG